MRYKPWTTSRLRIRSRTLYEEMTRNTAANANHPIEVVSGSSSLTCILKREDANVTGMKRKAVHVSKGVLANSNGGLT